MTNNEILIGTRTSNLLEEAIKEHPSFLVRRAIFENVQLTIEEVDYYLSQRTDEVDRVWLLKQLAEGSVLDAPYHLIKLILKQ